MLVLVLLIMTARRSRRRRGGGRKLVRFIVLLSGAVPLPEWSLLNAIVFQDTLVIDMVMTMVMVMAMIAVMIVAGAVMIMTRSGVG
jgi:hypothetical protein